MLYVPLRFWGPSIYVKEPLRICNDYGARIIFATGKSGPGVLWLLYCAKRWSPWIWCGQEHMEKKRNMVFLAFLWPPFTPVGTGLRNKGHQDPKLEPGLWANFFGESWGGFSLSWPLFKMGFFFFPIPTNSREKTFWKMQAPYSLREIP